jgi:hypothetical protein
VCRAYRASHGVVVAPRACAAHVLGLRHLKATRASAEAYHRRRVILVVVESRHIIGLGVKLELGVHHLANFTLRRKLTPACHTYNSRGADSGSCLQNKVARHLMGFAEN